MRARLKWKKKGRTLRVTSCRIQRCDPKGCHDRHRDHAELSRDRIHHDTPAQPPEALGKWRNRLNNAKIILIDKKDINVTI